MQGVTYQKYHPPGKKLNYDVVCGVAVSPFPPPPKQSCKVDMTLKIFLAHPRLTFNIVLGGRAVQKSIAGRW